MGKSVRSKSRRRNKRVRGDCLAVQADKDQAEINATLARHIREQTVNKRELKEKSQDLYAPAQNNSKVVVEISGVDDEGDDFMKVAPAVTKNKSRERARKRKIARGIIVGTK
mmetsp:Transcript_30067/g.46590  ORF Transcript_30067/g.46590 Transcript_30067/m.46590 type:complete len:112 (-) Transcript_30067:766-1101(-)|eukprot:CAMPEP_0201518670 /NCGR_PEP_ID=MMETSP0161_2-20130828/9445_1 /ASSEMBLY_ACC=CAM_ASM_000251 /TAXON_ID=180227 /ORGANISM="Neoparamoeba aestuarina, Strain SoJaBio B1-5/56/2" /LENGTH=111 /DNA_ID=CAMNT_0047916503 /DNA_START=184 /DNA_END=519 /DNA_ORIENTATION=+